VVKAHRVILAAHSETFSVAFNNASCMEVQNGVYEIAEEHLNPDILQDVLKWMYLHKIENAAAKAVDLLEAAEYFQIMGLKELSINLLMKNVTVENCLQMMNVAFKYNVNCMKTKCNDVFVRNRCKVMEMAAGKNLTHVVSHVPKDALELLGIDLERVKLKP